MSNYLRHFVALFVVQGDNKIRKRKGRSVMARIVDMDRLLKADFSRPEHEQQLRARVRAALAEQDVASEAEVMKLNDDQLEMLSAAGAVFDPSKKE